MVEIIWQRRIVDRLDAIIRENMGSVRQIGAAMRDLNELLLTDPAEAGESRDSPYRVVTVHPVTLYYRMTRDGRTVLVVGVEYYLKQRPAGST